MTFAELEQIRLKYVKEFKKALKISCAVILPIDAILIFVLSWKVFNARQNTVVENLFTSVAIMPVIFIIFFSLVVCLIIIGISTRKTGKEFKEAYKNYFVFSSLENIFTNIKYNHESGMDPDIVRRVMTTGNRFRSNDLMFATYKGINFTQADVHTEDKKTSTDSDGHTRTYYVTIFRGRFLIFDFNRNFNFNLQVSSKNFPGEVLPRDPKKQLKFSKIKTESGEFNKYFQIYGQDGVDTFYILDPAFMEKIQNLYLNLGKGICLTFMDGKVYIALNSGKDSFEAPSPLKPLDEAAETSKVAHDTKLITDFIDNLDLNHYTFKKEHR